MYLAHFVDDDVVPYKNTLTVKRTDPSTSNSNVVLIDGYNSMNMSPLPSESKDNVNNKSYLGHGNEIYHFSLKDDAISTNENNCRIDRDKLNNIATKYRVISQRSKLNSYFMGNTRYIYNLVHVIDEHRSNCNGIIRTKSRGFVLKNITRKVVLNSI